MAPQIKKLQEKYGITDEDLIAYGFKNSPMLSGRILEAEKKQLIKICKKLRSTQSKEIRKELEKGLANSDIDWNGIKLLKGETLRGMKTATLRIKVNEKTEQEVVKLCRKNKVTISALIRYIVVSYIRKNEGSK